MTVRSEPEPTFLTASEADTCARFLREGYVIVPCEDREALDRIRDAVAATAAEFLGLPVPADAAAFLTAIGRHVDERRLNDLRLRIINCLESAPWFRAAYFSCGRRTLEIVVGNELAMQRGVGFSIQLPHDASSVLPLHSDVWQADSPFEAVLWIPLVDCRGTMSMYLIPPEADQRWRKRMHEFKDAGTEPFFIALEQEARFIEIDYGNVLVFTHTLMHGNRLNVEANARWSINIRFKGLFTPYSDKQLGDFFDPITLRPITRIGLEYGYPQGFDG